MERVLVLDQSYQPIQIVDWKKAITLMTLGKVEVIKEYETEIRSRYLVLKVPSVIRFVRKFYRPRKLVKFSRVNVYARDRWSCQYCGAVGHYDELTYDHIIPKSRGGRTDWTNIVTSCIPCNAKKGNKTPEEAGMRLHKKPVRPDWVPIFAVKISRSNNVPDHWKDFCFNY